MALGTIAAKDKLPLLHGGQNPASIYPSYPDHWTICPTSTYCDAFATWGAWTVEQWKKEGKQLPVNIAGLTVDNPFGKSPFTASAIKYIEDKGAKFLGLDFFAPGDIDLTPQITRIAEKNANWIFTNQVAAPATNIVRSLVKLGYKDKIHLCANMYLFTEEYPRILGKDAEGEYGVNWSVCYGEGNTAAMEKAILKSYPQTKLVLNHFDGWAYAYCIKTAFKIALESKGYPITGEDFLKTVYAANGKGLWLDNTNGLFPAIDFSADPKDATGMHRVKITTCKDGKIVSLTDWIDEPHLSYLDVGK
jgi:ABC-type branched-subunit amino acid transport system substrate-binding protein